ncbi:acyl-CoA dehydrogenase [Streptomyces sp. NPDC002446]
MTAAATRPARQNADECGRDEAAALLRATRLDELLGDPYDPANPHGLKSVFAADERRQPPSETELLLRDFGLGAEFVPAELGGRLTRADLLARVLRPVFRRDVALGFSSGITSLFATAAVWSAGDERQRAATAELLLSGGRASIVHHELAHANAILRGEFTARPVPGGGFSMSGRKDVILNAARADAYVVYARTAQDRGPRSHSVLLVDPAEVPSGTWSRLPRVTTTGMRGGLFSGLEFTASPVPGDALVGRLGDGVALALRTFQVNRALIPGAVIAAADTVLHSAVRAATSRTGPVARRWHRPLAGVFADLLACDSMATVALRSLSLLPDRAHLLAAAVKYVVPDLLREDLEELATVLGAHGYDFGSPQYGVLDKLMRDLPVAGLGHAGAAACQAMIVPHLRRLAEDSWFTGDEPDPRLFARHAALSHFDYRSLGIAGGRDGLARTLVGAAARLSARRGTDQQLADLSTLAEACVGELRELRRRCRTLPSSAAASPPDPVACQLADRYALLLAAASVLGTWEAQDGTDPFLADPAWAVLALSRLAERLGIAAPVPTGDHLGRVLEELIRRFHNGYSCDLYAAKLTQ